MEVESLKNDSWLYAGIWAAEDVSYKLDKEFEWQKKIT